MDIFWITRRTCCAQRNVFKIDWLFADVETTAAVMYCVSLQQSFELSPTSRMWSCCMVHGILMELTCRSFVESSKYIMTTRIFSCYVMIVNFDSRFRFLNYIKAPEWLLDLRTFIMNVVFQVTNHITPFIIHKKLVVGVQDFKAVLNYQPRLRPWPCHRVISRGTVVRQSF